MKGRCSVIIQSLKRETEIFAIMIFPYSDLHFGDAFRTFYENSLSSAAYRLSIYWL